MSDMTRKCILKICLYIIIINKKSSKLNIEKTGQGNNLKEGASIAAKNKQKVQV